MFFLPQLTTEAWLVKAWHHEARTLAERYGVDTGSVQMYHREEQTFYRLPDGHYLLPTHHHGMWTMQPDITFDVCFAALRHAATALDLDRLRERPVSGSPLRLQAVTRPGPPFKPSLNLSPELREGEYLRQRRKRERQAMPGQWQAACTLYGLPLQGAQLYLAERANGLQQLLAAHQNCCYTLSRAVWMRSVTRLHVEILTRPAGDRLTWHTLQHPADWAAYWNDVRDSHTSPQPITSLNLTLKGL